MTPFSVGICSQQIITDGALFLFQARLIVKKNVKHVPALYFKLCIMFSATEQLMPC